MKETKDSEIDWIIFSVLSVVLPVCLAFVLSCIINKKIIAISNIIDNIILVVFSIACSLLSICRSVNKQKSDKFTKMCYGVSISTMFLSWTTYIVSLTGNLIHMKIICICSLIFVILCSILGVILGKKGDKNKNETIHLMHCNCDYIRVALIKKENNDLLKSQVLRDYDLLCNPSEFDRVKEVLKNMKCEVINNDK